MSLNPFFFFKSNSLLPNSVPHVPDDSIIRFVFTDVQSFQVGQQQCDDDHPVILKKTFL